MDNGSPGTWAYYVGNTKRTDGEPVAVRACFDDSLVGTTFRPPDEAIEEAVTSAVNAFEQASCLPVYERAEILRSMSEGVESHREEFARILALEAGKPVKAGRVEVDRCVFNLRNASEETQRIEHNLIPLDLIPAAKNRWGLIRRFPLGAILAITPFNFPLNLVAHKVAPAIASGNTVVQKPASKTPICSLLLAQIAYDAGIPDGMLNVLPCSAEKAEKLVGDDRFKLLTFTGSSEIGWQLKSKAAKKRVTLELGGNAGVIIHGDADVTDAARRCALGGFSYSGQSCISVQRIFVQASNFDKFVATLKLETESLKVGNPLDADTDVGPMITPADAERVENWVGEAVESGAELVTGGERSGAIFYPTVLTCTKPQMKVNCLEVFGPVVTVEPYDELEDAFEAVNDSAFGLQAGIFTNDNRALFAAFEQLEVGGVVANDVPTFRVDHMPYGGAKDSGTGREGARYAIEEMTERKILVLNLD
jgi:acyl-CoA reductase-like NAD-dependent aldehyde dehydrogenase